MGSPQTQSAPDAVRVRTSEPTTHAAVGAVVRERTTCRSCGSGRLRSILSLGNLAVSNFVTGTEDVLHAPLDLVLCEPVRGGCGLLQLRHTVEAGFLYRNYWYRSGVNRSMQEALGDIVRSAERIVPLRGGDMVVDIGSNDGTLLRAYSVPELVRVGFEPATNLMPYAQQRGTVTVNDFFSYESFRTLFGAAAAKVVTSIAMFYDLEDPNAFVADVARCLHPQGLWVIQMAYLPSMLEQNAFDNICHEHLEYYGLGSLRALLERHYLRVLDVSLNDVNGGSFRIFVTHRDADVGAPQGAAARIRDLEELEARLNLADRGVYEGFAQRIGSIRGNLSAFIRAEVTGRHKTVDVYGASTKGNTLLQYFGLDHALIRSAAERNPDKWGKRTVGTAIPIVSEEEARKSPPDYFLVLPWHFLMEFVQRERAYLQAGGKFIVPLPQFRVVEWKNESATATETTPT